MATSKELLNKMERSMHTSNMAELYIKDVMQTNNIFLDTMQIETVEQLQAFRQFDIDEYIEKMVDNGNSVSTINKKISHISTFFEFLFDNDIVNKNYIQKKKIKVKQDAEQRDEDVKRNFKFSELVKMLPNTSSAQEFVMETVLLGSGIRIGGLLSMQIGNVKDGQISVFEKGSKWRDVQVLPIITDILKQYIKDFRAGANENDIVFIGEKCLGCMSRKTVNDRMKCTAKITGLSEYEDIHPHSYRHAHAEEMLNKYNIPLDVIGKNLGHSVSSTDDGRRVSSVTTNVYATTSIERVRQYIDKIDYEKLFSYWNKYIDLWKIYNEKVKKYGK